MTRDECVELAKRLAEDGAKAGARGVLVAVSHDGDDGHSNYGVSAIGPCLELEGLGCRIKHYLRNLWALAHEPPVHKPAGTVTRS